MCLIVALQPYNVSTVIACCGLQLMPPHRVEAASQSAEGHSGIEVTTGDVGSRVDCRGAAAAAAAASAMVGMV
jgi:hypothetical protein